MIGALGLASLVLAVVPAAVFTRNLRLYRRAPPPGGARASVLIPARDEAPVIEACVRGALASGAAEVLVLDDASTDGTGAIVERIGGARLLRGEPLPPGWCGKQHACAQLARAAREEVLVFVDADVRLEPGSAARLAAFLDARGADLASGVPRQETGSPLERLVVPLVSFVLLAYLPIGRARRSRHPAYGAGCGQLVAVRRSSYERAGGHAAIASSLHDGVELPRAFRRAGLVTDLVDATDLATCRMYRGARATWRGFAKNATEGLGSAALIGPASIFLLGGQVLPFALAPWSKVALAGAAVALVPRLLARRFGQPVAWALLHPVGVLVLVAIQWAALARRLLGRGSSWKGRVYV